MGELIQALILGIVQGITAWIPVSSKTQVLLVGSALFSLSFQTAIAYALVFHIGDLMAALYKYRREYLGAARLGISSPAKILGEWRDAAAAEQAFLILSIIATCVIALPAYLLAKHVFANLSGEWLLAAVGLLLLVMAGITFGSRRGAAGNAPITRKNAILTGMAQGLAVIPGISRSGITQCSLLLQGVRPEKAMRLSFLMSAPMIAAAFVAFYFVEGFAGIGMGAAAIGIAASAIVSFFTMDALTKLAKRMPAHYFLAAIGLLAIVPLLLKLALGVGE